MAFYKPEPAFRRCLGGCDQQFWSRDKGHRICPACARKGDRNHSPRRAPNSIYVRGRHFNIHDE